MQSTATLYVVVFTAVGVLAGWHFRRAQAANSDLKVHKARIPGFRRVRARSGLTSIALIGLTLLALRALARLPRLRAGGLLGRAARTRRAPAAAASGPG